MNWYKKKKKNKDKEKSKDFIDISGAEMDVVQRPNNTGDSNDETRAV